VSDRSDQSSSPDASPIIEVAEELVPNVATNLPTAVEAALPIPAGERAAQISPILKAITEPDIYTAPSDRDRAIILRWVLRDIDGNRLKLTVGRPRSR
jgi:hypothetical protein